ncbi:methyltransferase domain-containing protein [Spiractinospora alimapuensis]|uniref:methyltransferase domain-containing protein n=1 Tax=Spiractinospora alimapuensis TaxID=2820884 RepID=UPI001F296452|nr:methyltransferase domain-containing protein [Spiractinospora alimapuensis]QVQ50402.1 methyltransferase domain-containing protein [Spiractinospora alimapuensis]
MVPEDLRDHPDRRRWNARFADDPPGFPPHPLAADAMEANPPPGPVLELAAGRSGSALELAAMGRTVTVVDVSDVALDQLTEEAERRDLGDRVHCVLADATRFRPEESYAIVLATRYWDEGAFDVGAAAVSPGGLFGWEALAAVDGETTRFRVRHGALGARLPRGFAILTERQLTAGHARTTRLLARRTH